MNKDDYAEFSLLVDATIVVDRIDLDDSDNDLITTNIDVDVDCPDSTKIDLHLLRNELEAELGATIDLDGEGLVPVTWGLELTSADKN